MVHGGSVAHLTGEGLLMLQIYFLNYKVVWGLALLELPILREVVVADIRSGVAQFLRPLELRKHELQQEGQSNLVLFDIVLVSGFGL